MIVYTATLSRRRMFGLRAPMVITSEPCATAQGALIDLCAKYAHRFGSTLHTRSYGDRLDVRGAAA